MTWLAAHWERVTPVSVLLYPLSLLFRAAVAVRRAAYRAGLLASTKLPVPVIVVGNIAVGGTGKTPLVLWLCTFLRERGRRPGIVSRGYGGAERGPAAVGPDSDPRRCGDEPVLLAQRSGCPVWIGADRAATGRALLAAHPECDLIVSDDGLQHYGLARDVEIAVFYPTGTNLWLLPAGPYREHSARLAQTNAIVLHEKPGASFAADFADPPLFSMTVEGSEFCNLLNPALSAGPEHFRHGRVEAVAGIGHPQRFFRHLQQLGITFTAHPFPDHHVYREADLAFPGADAVLMTEKDAVKCRRYASELHWALRVDARVEPALGELVLGKLAKDADHG